MEKTELRAVFEKKGRAVYISHLDLFRTMQRALKRSKLPVWYSQGFNPHIYLNFPLALSLGVSSSTEYMDFSVTEEVDLENVRKRLDAAMPDGLSILDIARPIYKNKDIGYAEYEICFESRGAGEKMLSGLDKMLAAETIEIDKRSKSKGTVKMDIRPYIDIKDKKVSEDTLTVSIRLPAGGDLNINSNVFTEVFSEISGIKFDSVCAKRTKILCKNGEKFI